MRTYVTPGKPSEKRVRDRMRQSVRIRMPVCSEIGI